MIEHNAGTSLTLNPDLRLFTVQELAGLLKMNSQVIARKLASGEIEGFKLGKDWRISEAQLLEYLQRHSNTRRQESASDKILRSYIKDGRLLEIPAARKKRDVILKFLAGQFDGDRVYSEAQVNEVLASFHRDVCTLRRELIGARLMVRKDGRYKLVSWQ